MGWSRKLFDGYLYGSLHVALAVCALLLVTVLEYGLTPSPVLLLFVFSATVFSYNIIKYHWDLSRRTPAVQISYPMLRLLTFVALVAALSMLFALPVRLWAAIGMAAALSYFYGFPLRGKRALRALSGLKILIVAVVWSLVTVCLPWLMDHTTGGLDIWLAFLQRFLAVMLLTIPFEIRDMDADAQSLGTIPQRLGVLGAKWVGTALALLYLALEYFRNLSCWMDHIWSAAFIALALLALWFAGRERSSYYTIFWVELIPLIWLGLLIFGRYYLESSC